MHSPLRPVTPEDITHICAHMRPADRDECLAATGLPPEVVLPLSASRWGALTMVVPSSGEVLGLCGAHPSSGIEGFGIVWMLATTAISHNRMVFIRHARQWIELLHQHYPRLGNHVDGRNVLHIRWLQLLGFKLTGVVTLGPQSLPFVTFERSSTDNV